MGCALPTIHILLYNDHTLCLVAVHTTGTSEDRQTTDTLGHATKWKQKKVCCSWRLLQIWSNEQDCKPRQKFFDPGRYINLSSSIYLSLRSSNVYLYSHMCAPTCNWNNMSYNNKWPWMHGPSCSWVYQFRLMKASLRGMTETEPLSVCT